ncbi:MAG: stalk domain-containing protein [Clostridia bacterium]|nr:stalk domain-containing protein [Clostridia bacterium]
MRKTKKAVSLLLLLSITLLSIFSISGSAFAGASELGKMLVAHYRFDNDFRDSAGLGHDGLKFGNISFVNGVSGMAAKFDGKSYVEVEDSDYLDFDKGFTFSAWIYKDDNRPLRGQPIISKLAGNDEERYPYAFGDYDFFPSVSLIDQYDNSTTIYSQQRVDFQKWTLVTATFDGKSVKIYSNGVLKDNKTFSSILPVSTGSLYIGCNVDGETQFFEGMMDDVRLYNYALSPTEVEATFNEIAKGTGRYLINKPSNLVAYYKFDNDLIDYSGFKNDGTALGGQNGLTFANAIAGKGIKLDGSSYVEVKDSDSLDLDKFTFAAWLYKDGDDRNFPVLSKLGSSLDSDSSSYDLFDYDSHPAIKLFDEYGNNSTFYSEYDVDIEGWYFITATYDGKSLKIYHNGDLKDNKSFAAPLYYSSGSLLIGSSIEGETAFFKGMMDELRIYNYALTPEEVKALYMQYGVGRTIVLQLNNPYMTANGQKQEIDPGKGTTPISVEGKTLVPIGAIISTMGGKVSWNGTEKKVSIQYKDKTIDLWIGKYNTLVNGVSKTTDVAPRVINGRTMLPLAFVTQNLGCTIKWDGATKTITIGY